MALRFSLTIFASFPSFLLGKVESFMVTKFGSIVFFFQKPIGLIEKPSWFIKLFLATTDHGKAIFRLISHFHFSTHSLSKLTILSQILLLQGFSAGVANILMFHVLHIILTFSFWNSRQLSDYIFGSSEKSESSSH